MTKNTLKPGCLPRINPNSSFCRKYASFLCYKAPKFLLLQFAALYTWGKFTLIYRVSQKSFNPKHSVVLMGMFRFKPASQFVWRYRSVLNCAVNMEDLISNIFFFVNSITDKGISNLF
jgi:hypothetical protein